MTTMERVDNCLDSLPDEIIIKILSYLDTYDVMKYCEAFLNHGCFLLERPITRYINLSKEYRLEFSLYKDLLPKLNPSHVTVFNVNGIYWVPAEELRNCIRRFCNLEKLYILDTKFTVSEKDAECLSNLSKLDKIAVCVDSHNLTREAAKAFPNVKSLMLHLIGTDKVSQANLEILATKERLEDLWLIDKTQHLFCRLFPLVHRTHLKRFVYKSSAPISVSELKCTGMKMVHENRKYGFLHLESGCKDYTFDPSAYDLHFQKFWEIWSSLRCHLPYGVEDAKRLAENDPSFSFKELNFSHDPLPCCARYLDAIKECLNSHTARNLRKLSFQCCFLEGHSPYYPDTKENVESVGINSNLSKKAKLSITNPLNNLGIKFYNLRELEIWPNCVRAPKNSGLNYNSISYLENLEKFTLFVSRTTPVKFIVDVLQKCKRIRSLSIICKWNEPFMNALCSGLKFAENLRDFRCETFHHMNVDKILEGLTKTEDCILERLVLKTVQLGLFSRSVLRHFLQKNPQIVFVCLQVRDITEAALKVLRFDFKTFKTSSKKIFLVLKGEDTLSVIPEVHRYEMMNLESNISICDVYNDFIA